MPPIYHRKGSSPPIEPGPAPDKIARPDRRPIRCEEPHPPPSYYRPSYYRRPIFDPPSLCYFTPHKPLTCHQWIVILLVFGATLGILVAIAMANPPDLRSPYGCVASCLADDSIANHASSGTGGYHSVMPSAEGKATCFKKWTECYANPEAKAARDMSKCKRDGGATYKRMRASLKGFWGREHWGRGYLVKEKRKSWE